MWNNQGGFHGYDQGQGGQGGQGGYMSPGGFGTPQQSQEKKTRSRAQNLLPCTVAEIFNTTQNDDKFFSGEIEISQVTIVGLIRSVRETTTRLDYEIDDMSGPPIEVKQFVDNDETVPDEEKVQAMRENTYVRVCGHVRSFGGKRSIVAFKMTPIADMNEVTCHILEVIHSHVMLSQDSSANAAVTSAGDATIGQTGYNDMTGAINGLTPIQSQTHLCIKSNSTEHGASIESVCKQLRGVPEKSIREAIEFLSSEGHIYSTIDEDHYKATDS
ncbi:hypothetical protein ScPMuIL_006393 [Solemya velum]